MIFPMRFWTVALCAMLTVTCAQAARLKHHPDESSQLMALELETRMEQRCNGQASTAAMRDHKLSAPDEIVAYAYGDDHIRGTTVEAPGAAIRDGGHWYHLSYACQTTPDGLGIVSFQYRVGPLIPKEEWAAHQLVD
jgi:hypothetical protein